MKIPRLYAFTIRELIVLGISIFMLGVLGGQAWRILQVESGYQRELKRVADIQNENRKQLAKTEIRLMDVEKKLKIGWRPYERTLE